MKFLFLLEHTNRSGFFFCIQINSIYFLGKTLLHVHSNCFLSLECSFSCLHKYFLCLLFPLLATFSTSIVIFIFCHYQSTFWASCNFRFHAGFPLKQDLVKGGGAVLFLLNSICKAYMRASCNPQIYSFDTSDAMK